MTEKKTIYEQLQDILSVKIEPAPDEWDRLFNVDFFIKIKDKFIGLQIKPAGYAFITQIINEEAVIREAKEETDLDLADLRQFHTYSAPGRDPRFHTIGTVFIAQARGKPKAGDDAAGLKIVKLSELKNLDFAFDHKKILEDYIRYKQGKNPF